MIMPICELMATFNFSVTLNVVMPKTVGGGGDDADDVCVGGPVC